MSDVYSSDATQKQSGNADCMRTLRKQSEDGELHIVLSADTAENILLSYQKR